MKAETGNLSNEAYLANRLSKTQTDTKEYVVNGSFYYGLVSNRTALVIILTYNCGSDGRPEKGGISKATHSEE